MFCRQNTSTCTQTTTVDSLFSVPMDGILGEVKLSYTGSKSNLAPRILPGVWRDSGLTPLRAGLKVEGKIFSKGEYSRIQNRVVMTKHAEQDFFDKNYTQNVRAPVGQVYSLIHGRNRDYEELIYSNVEGRMVLEYGCGEGSHSLEVARRGAHVIGIDISEVGVKNAAKKATAENVDNAEYLVMDAENMTLESDTFDMVIGEGILHHLDLEKSYREIARVLKPEGKAVFMEPLGHNPAIWLFRRFTPGFRTADEHPLMMSDLKQAGEFFGRTDVRYYHLTSFAAMLLLKTRIFFPTVRFFDKVDSFLFRVVPPLGLWAWYSIITLSDPIRQNQLPR